MFLEPPQRQLGTCDCPESSLDLKPFVVHQDFLHTLEFKWRTTDTAEVSLTRGVKQMLQSYIVSHSPISQQILTECLLCVRRRASEGDQGQTDFLINDKAF